MTIKSMLLAAALVATPFAAHAASPIPGVKNIIIIVNDGGGPTVYDATRMYLGKPLFVDSAPAKTFVSTYPLREDGKPNSVYSTDPHFDSSGNLLSNNTPIPGTANSQQAAVVYDSAKFWDATPVADISKATGYNSCGFAQAGFSSLAGPCYQAAFKGYEWSRFAHPDSGNTASALASGKKTYNNAINVDGEGNAQTTITDLIDAAKTVGKATGVVTTVELSDATPAALGGAHNIARANRNAISFEMFSSGKLDVIGGGGNPDYNDDSVKVTTPNNSWVSSALWADLKNKTNTSGGNAQKWTLVQDRATIAKLANKTYGKPPAKLAMVYQSFTSSQFNRTNTLKRADGVTSIDHTEDKVCDPSGTFACEGTPRKTAVPTQTELTLAALNALDVSGRGFYLMSEAGAVDRAEHANDTARMIEEQIASDMTVKAVIDWVNRPDTAATMENTLIIVTADHDHLLYGPDSVTVPFQPLKDNGPGKVPGNKWHGPNHGNGLVPLFAFGKGAAEVMALASHTDETGIDLVNPADGKTYHLGHGAYVDQAELGAVLKLTAQQAQ